MNTTTRAHRFDAYHVLPDSPQMQRDFLYVMASLAARAGSPLAADIVRVAKLNGILPVSVEGFQEFPEKGFGGLLQLPNEQRPRAVLSGTRYFVAESGLQMPAILEATAQQWERQSGTLILMAGWDAWVRGVLKFVADS
jgi:cation transport ATPase